MCRALAYLGQPVSAEYLLYSSDSSLMSQVFQPKMLAMLNLAGFGMVAWDAESLEPGVPWRYHSTGLPVFDCNLRAVSSKIHCNNLLAHIRGVPMEGLVSISEQNLHPFIYPGMTLAMAHNGNLYDFPAMRYALISHIRKEILSLIRGNTDSEWIYALLMSRFEEPTAPHTSAEIALAVQEMLEVLRQVRASHNIDISSSVNLFISNPNCLVAARFGSPFPCNLPVKTSFHETATIYNYPILKTDL
jgi:predicted glutamine amidotransferase